MSAELISESAIPQFERGVRLKHDRVRERYVVLGPEMLIELNQTGTAIMSEVDGQSTLTTIVSRLAERFEVNPQDISQDVREFCTSMVMRRVLQT
jgi:pyrroloquinoline quinone biosynthesis protein D